MGAILVEGPNLFQEWEEDRASEVNSPEEEGARSQDVQNWWYHHNTHQEAGAEDVNTS